MPAARERSGDDAFDSSASMSFIERLGSRVLLEHPQVECARPAMREEMASRPPEQLRADPEPLELVTDVEIVQQGSPGRISVANRMRKAE